MIAGSGALAPAARAARTGRGYLKGPAFDLDGVTLDQGQGHLVAGLGHDALKGGTRDAHTPGRFLLSQAVQVGQAQGFQFFLEKSDAAQPI